MERRHFVMRWREVCSILYYGKLLAEEVSIWLQAERGNLLCLQLPNTKEGYLIRRCPNDREDVLARPL